MTAQSCELRCTLSVVAEDASTTLLVDAELIADGVSEVLAHGQPVWAYDLKRIGKINRVLWGWLGLPGDDGGERADPERLPDAPGLAYRWGQFITELLCLAVGRDALGRVVEHARSHGPATARMAVRTPGSLAGLPVETAVWPPCGVQPFYEFGVSVVRVADAVCVSSAGPLPAPSPLVGREGGRYVALAAASAHRSGLDLDAFCGAVHDVDRRAGLTTFEEAAPILALKRDDKLGLDAVAVLRRRLLSCDPDLLVCCGHGKRARGWQLGPDMFVSGRKLGEAFRGGPSAVVLAMCGSATPGPAGEPSTVTHVARRSAGITIGLQGRDSPEPHVLEFVRRLLEDLSAARLADSGLTMLEWERAILAARDAMGEAGILPVAVVHPVLLAARRAENTTYTRAQRTTGRELGRRTATATPWYVPGQVAWFQHPARPPDVLLAEEISDPPPTETLRVPLPVDAGAVIVVELARRLGGSQAQNGASPTSLPDGVLRELIANWPLPAGQSLEVQRTGAVPPGGWATGAAELSAVVRALSHLLEERPPQPVLDMLDELVGAEWGAHDAAARAVRISDGVSVARFAGWPDVAVATVDTVPPGAAALEEQRDRVLDADHEVDDLVAGINGDFKALAKLAARHSIAVRDDDALLPEFQWVLQYDNTIAVPDGAELAAAAPTEGGWVRMKGVVERERADASHWLRD